MIYASHYPVLRQHSVCIVIVMFGSNLNLSIFVTVKDKEEGQIDSDAKPMKDEGFGEYRYLFSPRA